MELLNFMYSNTLSIKTAPGLLDVLMAADKFEVASCMRYCSRLLRNIAMTPESALLYLELPSSVLMAEAVQPLTDAAKQYLASRYKDITKQVFVFILFNFSCSRIDSNTANSYKIFFLYQLLFSTSLSLLRSCFNCTCQGLEGFGGQNIY